MHEHYCVCPFGLHGMLNALFGFNQYKKDDD